MNFSSMEDSKEIKFIECNVIVERAHRPVTR